jgi:hypothetical protein
VPPGTPDAVWYKRERERKKGKEKERYNVICDNDIQQQFRESGRGSPVCQLESCVGTYSPLQSAGQNRDDDDDDDGGGSEVPITLDESVGFRFID